MADSRTADKFVVRLPDGLRGRIFDVSAINRRSMNSEIVHRLEHSLELEQELEHQKNLVRVLSLRLAELEPPR
ncbi:Arc family DNA-binding protein [uncultured Pseudomonas sp.]|uniref:Arc family DNA-binding protein n=1 Tax=uncultured Pseudomonas sp. TaxID=114707 RepID=UPI0025CEB51D|nr:Arc family DNA-binding protein [uncultured Pseudomonas sp.]